MATAIAQSSEYISTPSPSPYHRTPSSSSISRSPDVVSPIYASRAIRPLPKNRLKSKLSPEQVTTLRFPPAPAAPVSPIMAHQTRAAAQTNGHATSHGKANVTNGEDRSAVYADDAYTRRPQPQSHASYSHERDHHHSHCTCGEDGASGDEEVEFDHPDYRYTHPSSAVGTGIADQRTLPLERRLLSAKPPTNNPSSDGYESFENTSNKKKRKIPLSSGGAVGSTLSAEMAQMGISSSSQMDGTGGEDGVGATGTGISGAGRGRYGRQNSAAGRRSIGTGAAAYPAGTGAGAKALDSATSSPIDPTISNNTNGIISQAIKTAAAQGPLTPLPSTTLPPPLPSTASATTTPKTQFTFAVESASATKMADVQHVQQPPPLNPNPHGQGAGGPASTGYATSVPGAYPGGNYGVPAPPPPPHPNNNVRGTQTNAPPPPPQQQQQPKPYRRRRSPSKEFALAARQRQLQQEYTNYHHPPKPAANSNKAGGGNNTASNNDNELYICAFCEYEDIFGVPPLALIRSYEIRDRQERKRREERRRLLEKAKGRGKRGGGKKGAAKGAKKGELPPPALSTEPRRKGEGEVYEDEEEFEEEEGYEEDDLLDGEGEGGYEPQRGQAQMPVGVERERGVAGRRGTA